MNSLLNLSGTVQQGEVTMTSLAIVEFINAHRKAEAETLGLTFPSEKFSRLKHSHFVEKLPQVLGGMSLQRHPYQHPQNGQQYFYYDLPKREACRMAMSYSWTLQAAVYDHMTRLEEQLKAKQQTPPPPQPLLLMPPIEEAARAASAISDCLRLEGTERASMLASTIKLKAPEYLPLLPAYATNAPRTQDGKLLGGEGNSKAAFAASPLLKKFNSQLSIHAFNKLAEASGFLETIERPSTKHEGLAKTFKSVTDKGLEYGYNLSHENSKGSTQPVWFQHKFEELLETLTK